MMPKLGSFGTHCWVLGKVQFSWSMHRGQTGWPGVLAHLGPDASRQGQQGPGKQEDEGQAQGPGPYGVLCLGQRLVGRLLCDLLFLQAPSCSACCPQAGIQTDFRHFNLATPFATPVMHRPLHGVLDAVV